MTRKEAFDMTQANARRAALLCAALALPLEAGAQGFTGYEGDLRYRHFGESGDDVFSGRSAVEFGIAPGLSVQGDVIFGYLNAEVDRLDTSFQSFVLHGIVDSPQGAAFGAFAGREYALGDDRSTLGLEAAFDVGGSEMQPWVSRTFGGGRKATTFGLTAESQMAAGFGLQGSIITTDVESRGRSSDFRFGVTYNPRPDFPAELFATAGYSYASATPTRAGNGEASIGIGARIGIGSEGGTTFGSRSIFEAIR